MDASFGARKKLWRTKRGVGGMRLGGVIAALLLMLCAEMGALRAQHLVPKVESAPRALKRFKNGYCTLCALLAVYLNNTLSKALHIMAGGGEW